MADINNQSGGGGTSAIAWVVLLIVIVLIGWFLLRGGFGSGDADINVNVPEVGTESGGTSGGTQ